MWTFRPGLWKAGLYTELPRPLTTLRLIDTWDFEKYKTPVSDGDHVTGHSRNGVEIQIEGQFGTIAGEVPADEGSMFDAVVALRQLLDVSDASGRFWLALYQDPSSGLHRVFRECSTVRFETDLSDAALFSYSAVIHASDPVLSATMLA